MKRKATVADLHRQLVLMTALVAKRAELGIGTPTNQRELQRQARAVGRARKCEERRYLPLMHRQLVMTVAMLQARHDQRERVARLMLPWAKAMVLAQLGVCTQLSEREASDG